jgi:putative transposase
MNSSRHTREQVTFAMRQSESGTAVPEVCRKMGIAEQTFYRWKKKYAGMGVAKVRKLRILEHPALKVNG